MIAYLTLAISCSCFKLFQFKKLSISSTLQEYWETESIPLPCGIEYKSIEFMKACFHAFVLQLSRYMKIRWCIMKYAFIDLYCNYQGTWKLGEDMKVYLHKFVLQLSRYMKMINWCWFIFEITFQACKKAYCHEFMFLCHDSWPKQKWVFKCEMFCFYTSQKNKSKHVFQGVLSCNKNRLEQFFILLCCTLFWCSLDYKFELV